MPKNSLTVTLHPCLI